MGSSWLWAVFISQCCDFTHCALFFGSLFMRIRTCLGLIGTLSLFMLFAVFSPMGDTQRHDKLSCDQLVYVGRLEPTWKTRAVAIVGSARLSDHLHFAAR